MYYGNSGRGLVVKQYGNTGIGRGTMYYGNSGRSLVVKQYGNTGIGRGTMYYGNSGRSLEVKHVSNKGYSTWYMLDAPLATEKNRAFYIHSGYNMI